MQLLDAKDIGGGIARRLFTSGLRTFRNGDLISRETILSWPAHNRKALIANRFIEVYPLLAVQRAAAVTAEAAPVAPVKPRKTHAAITAA